MSDVKEEKELLEEPLELTEEMEIDFVDEEADIEGESSFLSNIKNIFANKPHFELSKKNEKEKPLITILGVGAIGGTISAILAESGCRINCISSVLGNKRISSSGLYFDSPATGEIKLNPKVSSWIDKKPEALIIAVNGQQLNVASSVITKSQIANIPVLCLTSGVDSIKKIRAVLGKSVSIGAVDFFASRTEKNRVEAKGGNYKITMSNMLFAERERLEKLASILRNAGIETEILDSEADVLWTKTIPFTVFSLYYALTGKHNYEYSKEDEKKIDVLIDEMVQIARKEGFHGSRDSMKNILMNIPEKFIPDLYKSIQSGRKGELKTLAVDIIKIAEKQSVKCPNLKLITSALMKKIEEITIPKGSEVDYEEIVPDNIEDDDMFIVELSDEEFAIVMDEATALGEAKEGEEKIDWNFYNQVT